MALFAWKALSSYLLTVVSERGQCSGALRTCQARNAPSAEKNRDASGKKAWARPERAGHEEIDKQQPHTDELREPPDVEESPAHPARPAPPGLRFDRSSFRS